MAPLHFAAFFALLFLTSQRPEMGNGGIYSFAYIYLTGNPVAGEALARRGLMALTGWLVCGAILLAKHRGRHADTRFHHLVRRFRLSRPECLWQLRMALGVSLVLAAGQVFGVERFMWMGFACGSLLSEYPLPGSTAVRFWQRIAGAAAGCAAFALLYLARPSAFVSPRCSTGYRAAFCPRRTQPSEPKHKTKTGAPLLAVRRFFGLFSEPCSRTLDYRGFLMAA